MTDEGREAADPAVPISEPRAEGAQPTPPPAAAPDSEPEPAAEPGAESFRGKDPKALRLTLTLNGLVLGAITLVLLLAATLLVALVSLPPIAYLPALAVPALLSFPLLVLPRWQHRLYRYRVDDAGLEIRSGVWWRKHRFIPRSRLQHTDLAQGPLERRLRLANLVVHTAGTHEARTTVSGLALDTARGLRDRLIDETEAASDGV